MKLVILAGGYGTRLAEETKTIPKPLIKIGDKPIIWHIMKIYAHFGINNFIICLGYKGKLLKDKLNHASKNENWKIKYINTGLKTMTGGRIKRIQKHFLKNRNFTFFFFENISFAGLKLKFLSTQQKFYMSPTHPINMSSIGLKLMKLEQITFHRFFFPSLYLV